jgi:uncharacterized integral membrane protein
MKKFFERINMTPKQMLYIVLLILLIVFILQNMESVMVNFLFFGFKMPLVVIIVIVFIAGVLNSKVFTKKVEQAKNKIDEKLNS